MYKMKNKKAQSGELISDTVCLILIIFLLILFFILSSSLFGLPSKNIKTIANQKAIHDQEHISLQSWLQKKAVVDEQELTIAELIMLSKIDNSYESILQEEAKKEFGEYYDYVFEISSAEDIKLKVSYGLTSIAGTMVFLPEISDVKGSSFYIPSKETIAANLEIKELK